MSDYDFQRGDAERTVERSVQAVMQAMIAAAVVGGLVMMALAASVARGQEQPRQPDPVAPISAVRVIPKVIQAARH